MGEAKNIYFTCLNYSPSRKRNFKNECTFSWWTDYVPYRPYRADYVPFGCLFEVEPTKKLVTVFPAANAEVKRRRDKSEELEKLQAKVDKLREKERTGPNIVKLDAAEKQLAQVKRDFEQINDALLRDFGEFDSRKSEYFQP